MRPTKQQAKFIRKAVKNNTSNLRLAYIEASVSINNNLPHKMTITEVDRAWNQYIKYSKEVFHTVIGGKKVKNTKNTSVCRVKTTK